MLDFPSEFLRQVSLRCCVPRQRSFHSNEIVSASTHADDDGANTACLKVLPATRQGHAFYFKEVIHLGTATFHKQLLDQQVAYLSISGRVEEGGGVQDSVYRRCRALPPTTFIDFCKTLHYLFYVCPDFLSETRGYVMVTTLYLPRKKGTGFQLRLAIKATKLPSVIF